MTNKQRTWGQFATPIDVADLMLGFCLRRAGDRVLDPGCGDGELLRRAAAWQSWLDSAGPGGETTLFGVELDPDAAAVAAAIPQTTITRANFFTLDPDDFAPFDAVIGNPPYTRAEWIGRLDSAAGQLAMFPDLSNDPPRASPALPRGLGAALGGRAGLYAYFFLHSLGFLREGGRLGFVAPNGWLDVAYGDALKRFILEHYRVLAVIESAVERWFAAARVNTCIIILERCGPAADRAANRARFVRLRQPLRDLLGHDTDSRRVAAVEQLVTRLMPAADRVSAGAAARVVRQGQLTAGERWGAHLRAPEFYRRRAERPLAPLGDWATLRRGHTSGANDFFYLSPERVRQWGIEPEFRRPLLKSLRGVHALRLTAADCRHELLAIPADAALRGTAAAEYLAWGEAQGVAARTTCAARRPWYVLPRQSPGAILLAKGVWQRHFAPAAAEPIQVDQQIYQIALDDAGGSQGVSPGVAAALLNSAWFALGCELGGRVNFGEGVLWLASYELGDILLPDPRALDAAELLALEQCYERLAGAPVTDTEQALASDARRALDDLVFDLVGLPAAEREAARAALVECLVGRRRRARRPDERQGG